VVQVDREAAKKAKESAKKNLKKAQKAITALVTSNNYFTVPGASPAPATVEACFAELDLLFSALEAEEVVELKNSMEAAKGPDAVKLVLVEGAKKAEPKVGAGKFKEFA
jgi:DnaJ family protein C protein 2